ncbi:carboxymuconolactone decarboxylase family protein [Nocardioides sp. LHG3406-4]|uniref:carboxymuconolactone decarboxylase family protein n=1 Tax=Nocardioides sp. LHG3406-4 TaxID=2804575 RepID=UPI003CEEBAAB
MSIGAPDSLEDEQRRLYDAIAHGPRAAGPQHFALLDDRGVLNGPFNAFLLSPGLGQAVQALGATIRYESSLSARVREVSILRVAAHWDCEFEWHAHSAVARALGLDREIDAVREGRADELDDAVERAALAAVGQLLAGGRYTEDEYDAVASVLGERQLFELSTLVGYYSMLALQLRLFDVSV